MLVEQVMNRSTTINLQGFAIGDGCWGNTVGTCAFSSGDAMRISTNFYHGHAMISETIYQQIIATCGDFSTVTSQCQTLISQMNSEIGSFDVYNVYDECGGDTYLLDYFAQDPVTGRYYLKAFAQTDEVTGAWDSPLLGGAWGDYTCGGQTAMKAYLADAKVRAAIHVRTDNPGQRYTKTATNLLPLYKTLVNKYRTLIFSGDADACVPYYGTEEWTTGLNQTITKDWHSWTTTFNSNYSGVGGYVVNFAPDFTFLTIKGAGHMVPTYKPLPALTFFQRWLAGTPI